MLTVSRASIAPSLFWGHGPASVQSAQMKKAIYSDEYHALLKSLRLRREELGLSMRDIADTLKVHHSWVGKIELGERRLDVMEYVWLCDALMINPGDALSTSIRRTKRKTTYTIPDLPSRRVADP